MKSQKIFKGLIPLLASLLILSMALAACQSAPTPAPNQAAKEDVARPSNPGGPGPAVSLSGDAAKGEKVFAANCAACHGQKGVGGIANPGSTDGSVPPLNPIDETLVDPDIKVYTTNLDLFVEHGSTPEGTSPALKMLAFGDTKSLSAQDIADVLAYVVSINKK
jgi:mono/diheme cytochrome c family protein